MFVVYAMRYNYVRCLPVSATYDAVLLLFYYGIIDNMEFLAFTLLLLLYVRCTYNQNEE